jgi:RNA polymerase sigma-70 factor (ECF subfamily)
MANNESFVYEIGCQATSAFAEVVGIIPHLPFYSVNETDIKTPDSPEDAPDALLVHQALEDIDKFELLVQHYEKRLLRYILRISSFSHAEAEEILQEVFLQCWTNLRDYKSDLPFRSWIYRIAHNVTISTFRKHSSRGYDQQIAFDESLYELPSDELGLNEALDQKNQAKLVRTVLQSLPIQYRDVLVLRFFEGHDYETISDIIKKPSGTVATLLNRAKKAFLTAWERFDCPPTSS